MSIDDRIRRGMEANTAALRAPVERHLDRVRSRRRRRARLRVAAVVAAVAVVVAVPWVAIASRDSPVEPAPDPTPQVAGSYRVRVPESAAPDASLRPLVGSWSARLEDDGAVTLVPPTGYAGPSYVDGTYRVADGRLRTDLFLGWPGCQRTGAPIGVYDVVPTARALTFRVVADQCAPRRLFLAQRWEREP